MRSIVACGNCHTPQGQDGPIPGMELAGGLEVVEEGLFTACTASGSPHRWASAEVDRDALVAYLRSLPPVDNAVR
jgi:mono/diheme cytochrome c family protein